MSRFILALFLFFSVGAMAGRDIFVSDSGLAAATGTRMDPYRCLEDARLAIRQMKRRGGLPKGGVTVWVEGDVYFSDSFKLTSEDSGLPGCPITYRVWGKSPVRLSGGRRIPAGAFVPAVDERLDTSVASHIVVADLAKLDISDTGSFPRKFRGYASVSELFFNDQRLQLARWPNKGWTTVHKIIRKGSVPRSGDKEKIPGIIEYTGDRPSRWTKAKGLRLHGYWCFDWYDEALPVREINPETRQITFDAPHFYGIRQGNPPPRRWLALNLLEELDIPGEYFIDREAGKLYLYPPAALEEARIVVSTLNKPIFSLDNVSHVNIRGFTFENCMGTAVSITGGQKVQIQSCLLRNIGKDAISLVGGKECRIDSCDVHDVGASGILAEGGDRKKLIPAGHVVENNHVWRFARRQQTYAGGIHIKGVGNFVRHNLLHDAPHTAIFLAGNEHVVELNTIHHVCMETDDCGAFYKGRNPSNRGNLIRWNFWHHIGSPRGHGNNAVYFDDGDGGDTVFGNVFFRCGEPAKGTMAAVFSHGGHDLAVHNNIFVECKRALGASPWSNKRWKSYMKGKTYQTRLLKEVDITKPPFTTRYPKLVGFFDYQDEPRRSQAERNVVVMCGQFYCGNYDVADSFMTNSDPGFKDIDKGNFALRSNSEVYRRIPGFKKIPFAEIGLRKSDLRPHPVKEKWDYSAPKQLPVITRHAPRPKRAKLPAVAAKRLAPIKAASCRISCPPKGILEKGTWPVPPVALGHDVSGNKANSSSQARVMFSEGVLTIIIENEVPKGSDLANRSWGGDAVEIAIIRAKPAKGEKIIVLRGYPTGSFQVGAAVDAEEAPVWRQGSWVKYAAEVKSPTKWNCAWRIPLADLGYDIAKDKRFGFNITVRKAELDLWQMLQGTNGHSYDATQAAILELP